MHSVVRFGALLALFAALMGCARDRVFVLRAWTLQVEGAPARAVTLPAHLDVPDRPLTYRLAIEAPIDPTWRGRELSLVLPHFGGRATLRAGGAVVAPVEEPVATGYRGTDDQAWRIPGEATGGPTLALELEVEHRWTQSAWVDAAPELDTLDDARTRSRLRFAEDRVGSVIAIATLLTTGFMYLAVYLFDRRRSQPGLFALAAFTATIYPSFSIGWSQFLGGFELPVLATGVVVALVATVYFTHAAFDLGPPHPVWKWTVVVAAVASLVAHDPFVSTNILGKLVVAIVGWVAAYQLHRCAGAVRAKRLNGRIIFFCWILFSLTVWTDASMWLGLGAAPGGIHLAGWGLSAFALLQSVALSREHADARNRAEALNTELVARNDELRRQIAERSRDLSDLARRITSTPSLNVALEPGDTIADRYRVVRVIGAGAMGIVYEVSRDADGRRFAMKVIRRLLDGAALARFAQEAEIVARIDHPNVIAIHDVGFWRDGVMYLVMELVGGTSLAARMREPHDAAWSLAVLEQTATGLSAIHAGGFIHRDLKPGNILVTDGEEGPYVKITDFGISSVLREEDATLDEHLAGPLTGPTVSAELHKLPPKDAPLTETGALLGTPPYLAPELAKGMRFASIAADVFSLGVIAHELLDGKRPFEEPAFMSVLSGAYRAPPPLKSGAVPASVAEVLDRCLHLDPGKRPSAAEVGSVLRQRPRRATG